MVVIKKLIALLTFVLFFCLAPHNLLAAGEFITTWKTDNSGVSNSNQITIPTTGSGYNYTVDWGDSSSDSGVTGNITHTYASPGTYTVKISGLFPKIYFANGGDKQKILTIEQWGTNVWESMSSAFSGCSNLTSNASDSPDLSLVTDMGGMFSGATVFNGDLSSWDVSSVTGMAYMFFAASAFNSDISSWDVSSVTSMAEMFLGATSFNQDIGLWNVGSVEGMSSMFTGATSFNQNLGNWNVGSVIGMGNMFANTNAFNGDISTWNVSSVNDMTNMFLNAVSFNQNIGGWNTGAVTSMANMFAGASAFNQNIGSWDVSLVTNMDTMFQNATAFNQNLGLWNVGSVTTMTGMFAGATAFNQNLGTWNISNVANVYDMFLDAALSTENYDAILTGWSHLTLQPSLTFGVGSVKYKDSAAARQSIIDTYGWTINDGGLFGATAPAAVPVVTSRSGSSRSVRQAKQAPAALVSAPVVIQISIPRQVIAPIETPVSAPVSLPVAPVESVSGPVFKNTPVVTPVEIPVEIASSTPTITSPVEESVVTPVETKGWFSPVVALLSSVKKFFLSIIGF